MAAALVFCLTSTSFALDFPTLTGRVVDQANVMSAASRSAVEVKSKDVEGKSGIQLVVATVKSLQGSDIETYANQLFRFWKLGKAKKSNGVLLLVAPAEHKVRIAGRLWPRRHAHRRAVLGHHFERDRSTFQGE